MSRSVMLRILRGLGAVAALCLFATTDSSRVAMQAQSSCGATINPIVCENQKPGDPASSWDVSGSGDASIQGFTTNISAAPGEIVQFKIDTPSSNYRLDIYRMGYYSGMGARKVATVTPSASLPQNQPNCLTNAASGLIDCGNWAISASWPVPSDAVSGIYFAKLVRIDTGGTSHVFFVVREAAAASHKSDLLFQTSDTTWQAYNNYGGNSLYEGGPGNSPARAYKVSYNRPLTVRGNAPEDGVFNAEYPMVRFLEANGYDVSYFTGVDTDRNGALIQNHKAFLSVGHDEYWSGPQRTNVEAARAAGVSLAFFSGNEMYWKTRWENAIDGSGTPYRTLVSYKETHANAKIDPAGSTMWTGTWRDPRFSPPADGGRPENALIGQLFMVNDGDTTAITVPAANGKTRFWRNTTVATLAAGATATMPQGTLGYEWDADVDNGFRPNGLIELSQTTRAVNGMLLDYGSTFGPGTVTHKLSLYRHPSGALVFGAGTVQWSWGLDSSHDRGSLAADVRMKQATVNLFADMGAQPGSLTSGLVATPASTDLAPPTSTITAPAGGASFTAGTPITITGTAVESGGGLLSGVEVSTNGGATWTRATGTSNWSFSWVVSGTGSATIKSRSYDDSGNMETPSAGVTITITASGTCPCNIWAPTTVPPAPVDDGDPASVELGTKFRSDINGFITGVRFYKAAANTGTHTGTLWSSTGTQLATVTFTGETASGWQQMNFSNPVAITANTTYVISYHAPVGHYTGTDTYFNTAVDRPPLHGLRNGVDGANGLYAYSTATTFPTNTFNSENYWVDVVFTTTPPADTTAPTITTRFPGVGQTNVDPATPVTATFSEPMDAATISSSTGSAEGGASAAGSFELRDPSSNLVTATVTYDASTKVATLVPQGSLGLSTTYTVTVKGGATDPRVKDVAGNAMAATSTWTFTTAAAPPPPVVCPCSIWTPGVVPVPVDDGDPNAVMVGTRFRADIPGFISGARFYKAAQNTGTHVASLWTNAGALLGTATFSGESASGWQQVSFPTPIAIAANTTYVIAYLAPNGHYPGQDAYFATAGVDNGPLHALRNGVDGANGVYKYSTTTTFPTDTFQSEGYFVDVVFTTSNGPDVTRPTVKSVNPFAGASGVLTTTNVIVSFMEGMDPATITAANVFVRTPSSTVVPASLSYTAATNTATIVPTSSLAYSTTYTGVVKAAVKDLAGNTMAADFTWTFTTSAPPPPPPTQGPGGPVLVVTSAANPFSTYYAEILRGEGLNAFATADLSTVTSTVLNGYDAVILGEGALTSTQAAMFTNWVNAGGNLIAMRPDKQLAGLLGLTDAAATLSNAYLLVNTASAPGAGIYNQTMQFHGIADRYTLNGATSLATLYSNATTATANPAVTTRNVGSGKAMAFTYDLAKSVVYTRQGNPAWSGQERDGTAPIRSDDLFFGAKTGDVQPDWVDFNRITVPQADEQQRLLWNLILTANAAKKPLPHFWYFPRMLPAVIIMTGDDHANGGTIGRFNDYISQSTPGCSVADWQCIRGTSYIFPNTQITDAQVESLVGLGFEIGVHLNTNCADWTTATLPTFYSTQLAQFATNFPHAGAPKTNRTHCIVNSDFATQPQVELNNGIRLDTNYYYFPSTWILDRPGLFTGSGMPQRFTSLTGAMIDVYQATTQMTDESGQTFPLHANVLLDNAINLGYYGAFTANMHTDFNPSNSQTWSTAIINAAKTRNVPVVTAKQMLDWLDGRNASAFQSLTWNSNVLSFNTSVGANANGLYALLPMTAPSGGLTAITYNGSPLAFTTQTIKGVSYAVFPAGAGSYQASYGGDIVPPTISAVSVSPGATSATVTWTTNEPSTSTVTYGTSAATLGSSFGNSVMVTAHSVTVPSLSPATQYFYRVTSADSVTNSATSPAPPAAPLSFSTAGFTASGSIAPAASGNGTTVTLTGASSATATADSSGNYQFPNLPNGSYTATPSKAGFTFSPANRALTVSGANVSVAAFTAAPVTLSGSITPVALASGATVTLVGPINATTTADGSGAFSFSGVPDGSYTVTPSKANVGFTPANRTVVIAGGVSVSGTTFTAASTLTITGTITPGASGAGTTLTMTGGATATADGSGNYTFSAVADGSYTITPSKAGYTFTPASQSVNVSGASVPAINFSAQAVTLTGVVTPAASGIGATLTLAGPVNATATADASGAFSFSTLPNGSYTATPSKLGFTFSPASRTITIAGASVSGADFVAAAIPTYTASGSVSPAGAGTTLTLSGGANQTTSADSGGNYNFAGLPNGSYAVTPSKTGFSFAPASQAFTVSDGNVSALNFSAQAVTVTGTIAPAVASAGATVTLTGPASTTTTVDGAGGFSFSALPNGTYTVTPSKSSTTFSPASRSVTIANGVSVGGVDFTATAFFSLSGTLGPAGSFGQVGVAESAVSADASGNYTFTGLTNGAYTVTPVKPGYVFSPNGQAVTINGANVTGVNFTALPVTVSGTITPAATASGATVTLSFAAGITTTVDASGGFTLAGVPNGTYTVTPSKSGVSFTPANQTVTVVGGISVSGVSFTASSAATSTITIDVNKSAGKSTRVQTIASGAFTTTAGNELLLAFVDASNVDAAPTTVTGISGGSLTWTLVRRTNTQRGTAEIWRAFAPAVLTNATVTATLSQFAAAAINVVSFKGVDTTGTGGSGAIGATGSANAATGAPTASLVTTRNNSFVFGTGNDWDGQTARTLGPNQTLVSQFLGTDGDTFWVQRTTSVVATSGTTVTINDTAPANHRYNLTLVEILPALQ
jgi:N,N-dimethylformamidase beta subunit-like protein/uncharacterized protein DUF4082/Big-like domain-containing protein/purple acid phosphatase-like protein